MVITNKQARAFMLLQQGLLGAVAYTGQEGILTLIRQAGCIQYDPIDICGNNGHLVLYARVKNFKREDLYSLLYEKRKLLDQMDKMMAIYPVEDWPYFARNRLWRSGGLRSHEELAPYLEKLLAHVQHAGPVTSRTLPAYNTKVHWYGGHVPAEKAALETLYYQGRVLVHHKDGMNKTFDITHRLLEQTLVHSPDPFAQELDYLAWRVKRRIGAVGLLWNRASDAWLNIEGLTAQKRAMVFTKLLKEGTIKEVRVEDLSFPLYYLTEREPFLERAIKGGEKGRLVFLPPLDQMLWDRKLIKALYNFDYTWEIYTPPFKRKYGPYTLPVLKGTAFIGRIQMKVEKSKKLVVQEYWPEKNLNKGDEKSLKKAIEDFAAFHHCTQIDWAKE